ncbi:hypothetical protein OH779_02235 [Actinacidiphila glaucinigra]|uniref:hypothetical protein n=1 Tax=Actinacidiphila glaucinigra TaxID=235986 RepID=UPI003867265B
MTARQRGSWLGAVVVWSERVVVHDGAGAGPGEPVGLLHGSAGHAGEWEVVASLLIARDRDHSETIG